MRRRYFLTTSLAGFTSAACGFQGESLLRASSGHAADAQSLADAGTQSALPAESLPNWILRTQGQWDQTLWQQMLGAANEFKEGDQILGVAARDDAQRTLSRKLLLNTPISAIDQYAPLRDELYQLTVPPAPLPVEVSPFPAEVTRDSGDNVATPPCPIDQNSTLGDLRSFLLESSAEAIRPLIGRFSSDVIAALVRLLSNSELIQVGARIFNPLGNSNIGKQGYLGARIQPNSPTDHPDDIRWQVFDAFSYAVGDVLVGTNPVSSLPEDVQRVELALQDLLVTFGVDHLLPHCVLAHIDIQAEVEKRNPGCTEFWFQSIAGNDAANATFDISVQKMSEYARMRTGRFGLYFETGQGADFTNGHGYGIDMVTLESRKYGFASALTRLVGEALVAAGKPEEARHPWVHLNDVAGFIGPEVFRSKEQLVRCCLEDIVMGKLHGLTLGLDVCTTLHMDVTLDDLGWCIEQIMPACPAYLMALPTRIDPMLGYLTTSYQDHVRIRQMFGYRVNDGMWKFFQSLGVIDEHGQPTDRFGSPTWVYLQYCRRKGDARSDEEILADAQRQIAEVRSRGVFIAEGFGKTPADHTPELDQQLQHVYRDSRKCIFEEIPEEFVAAVPGVVALTTLSASREDYILHPTTGETLSSESAAAVARVRDGRPTSIDVQIVVSDGLNALAVTDEDHLSKLLHELRLQLAELGQQVAPEVFVVRSGRVRAGYRIGEMVFGAESDQQLNSASLDDRPLRTLLHIIGERPGSGHHTLSVYITSVATNVWSATGSVDHNMTQVVSGIANTALRPEAAAKSVAAILQRNSGKRF